MHPTEHVKLGVEQLWGLPIRADERVRLGRFRIDCEGSAWRVEDELELHTRQLLPVTPLELPGTPLELPGTPLERPLAASA